jgi:hypothetical protein
MSLQFWKPGTQGPGSSLDRATEAEGHVIPSAISSSLGIQDQRERLPIFKHRMLVLSLPISHRYLKNLCMDQGKKLLYCVEKHGVTIVVGQTGCGKTTREFVHCLDRVKVMNISRGITFRTSSVSVRSWVGSVWERHRVHTAAESRSHLCSHSCSCGSRYYPR